jgi:subtilisin family serine protease
MRRLALLLVPALLAACQDAPAPTAAPDAEAALIRSPNAIPGEYIVVFRDGADAPGLARQLTAAHGGTLRHTYQHAIRGFSASLPDAAVAALQRHPQVAYIEQDQPMHAISTTQTNATWGIDRVDQRDLPLSTTYTYANTGAGVRAYILDTGIRYSHVEFGGRATFGFDAFGGNGSDCNGHGTHVAGTVGGTIYGVAKGVSLVAVRVLDCNGSGTTAGVIAGVDWVTANHVKPAVANMSLGGGASSTLDNAVANSIAAGVSYGLAAGNGDFLGRPANACNSSPARVAAGITVGSTTSSDAESSFSNYGTCVDILAPGSSITSAWYQNDTQLATISGTSMATPHVVGAAALYLATNGTATPSQVSNALTSNASLNKISLHSSSSSNGTPNRLLYTGFIGGGGGTPGNLPPVAAFTYSCSGLTCQFTDASTDSDGTIASRSWTFGDGGTSTATNPSRTYASSGTYTVTLTVTDDDGATNSASQNVTVSAPGGGGITLSATGYKVQGVKRTDLVWSGATSTNVDVFRDNNLVVTTPNDGAHTDNTGLRGGGSHTYRVCEAGTSTCSPNVTVSY